MTQPIDTAPVKKDYKFNYLRKDYFDLLHLTIWGKHTIH